MYLYVYVYVIYVYFMVLYNVVCVVYCISKFGVRTCVSYMNSDRRAAYVLCLCTMSYIHFYLYFIDTYIGFCCLLCLLIY